MSKINELYCKIEELNKKIDYESNNSERLEEINKKISKLNDDIRYAGLHSDFSSVQQYKSQIAKLKNEQYIDYVSEYNNEILIAKNEIIKIIVDYYKKGNTIEDIIKIEGIDSSISDYWLNSSNFGKTTGYLFIDEIKCGEDKWIYSNPINSVKIYSKTLNDLISKINDNNEVLLIFDEDLAIKSQKRDLNIFQQKIDSNLRDLDNSNFENAKDIFSFLSINADNFGKGQIMYLCEIMLENIQFNEYSEDFNHILEVNKNKIDDKYYNETYQKIIGNIFSEYDELRDIILNLCSYEDKLTKNQILKLCDCIVKSEYVECFNDINHIFEINEDKVDLGFFDDFYSEIIDNHIKKLNEDDFDEEYLIDDLIQCDDKFTENQLIKLTDIMINEGYIIDYHNGLKQILLFNDSKLDNENYHEIYRKIIGFGLAELEDSNLECRKINSIFKYLNSFAFNFSKKQLNQLCDFIMDNGSVTCFGKYFQDIVEINSDEFGLEIDEIFKKVIDNKLVILKDFDGDVEEIMDDLQYFSNYFSKNQLIELINISVYNLNIYKFAQSLNIILINNQSKFDEIELDNIYKNIIDCLINKLTELSSTLILSGILEDLGNLSENITNDHFLYLCHIVREKKLIYFLNRNLFNLFLNKEDKFDDNINKEIIGLIIDYKLYELDTLRFGYPTARNILGFLKDYVNDFTVIQINELCNISMRNFQVYNCDTCNDNLEFLLKANKEKIDPELYEKTIIKNELFE